jgi:SAM-dependent MidA family methyltransferase
VVHHEVVAGRMQAARDDGTDPACGTGDQGDAVTLGHWLILAGCFQPLSCPEPDEETIHMSAERLPEPGPEAQAHSQRLTELIRDQVRANRGAIAFSRYMELALYAPGLGYYSAGARKFGAEGDFVTAPGLGPVFAHCVARALAPVLRALGGETVFFELGGGSGAFAADALTMLARLDALPSAYWMLEPSADLRERQQEFLRERLAPELFALCHWLDGPPEASWRGVLFANEVLDALPTPRFVIHEGEVYEEHVVLDATEGFLSVDQPADAMLRAAVRHVERDSDAPLPEAYRSEILLQEGGMLFCDYGYPRREYYLPERSDGTLVCHYRHRAHSDPFFLPGLQDITAFVDFTALAESGVNAGFDFAGYCSQSSFLLGNGLQDSLVEIDAIGDEAERYRRHQEIKRLTLPGEMGERFQFMGFQRGANLRPSFSLGELSRRL